MKKLRFWSTLVLAVMMMPVMVSCGDDDDDNGSGGGSNISYTPEEIVDILIGNWEVYGHYEIPVDNKVYESDYTASATFKNRVGFDNYIYMYMDTSDVFYTLEYRYNKHYVNLNDLNNGYYSIIRKNGKSFLRTTMRIPYVRDRNSLDYKDLGFLDFQIVNLSKTKLKLVADQDIDGKHYYISIISD